MLQHNSLSEQHENQLSLIFSTLKLSQLLRATGIRKSYGVSSFTVFQIIFQLVFQGRNLFRLLEGNQAESLPGKDVVYRFLNESRYNWRRFYQLLSLKIVGRIEKLTSAGRIRVFIIDDSVMSRQRSKKVELLARIFDHVSGRFIRGYSLLTLGWSDGYSFAPIDFTLMSSTKAKNRFCEMREGLDKRSIGYKRRMEALGSKPDAVVQMLEQALKAGFSADYVLMDSWFTHAPLLQRLMDKELHVIGMVKELKQRYLFEGKLLSLRELYAKVPKNSKAKILGSVRVQTSSGLSLKMVFVQNRNNRREWLAILTTDLGLDNAEMVRIYGMRWGIETFFKMAKSHLKLGTEFQGRSFDMMLSHTTIVFSRYLILEWERRENNDERSLGGLFYLFADEVVDLDLKTAIRQLMAFVLNLLPHKPENYESISQLHNWISGLPSYIKALFAQPRCES
ncbi:IS4 family transposase ISDha5 [bioreactor metagenome]|uniref:IS4 family transposase ISDha5 n=1 Tax=bioreactor metagenome TaxID=1076179 RepID=A0A644T078_9ZZZZ|nr:transposase [Desulfitobacterium hafniense]MEA5021346.1 transposase [Desulfitobacterium hafniense]